MHLHVMKIVHDTFRVDPTVTLLHRVNTVLPWLYRRILHLLDPDPQLYIDNM